MRVFAHPYRCKLDVFLIVFLGHMFKMFSDNGYLFIGHVVFTNLAHGGHDKLHQGRAESENTHFRRMLEQDALALPDGHATPGTIRDKHDIGRNLGG